MSNVELQEEEREVLLSIYEGDERFIQISPTTYQYKYGQDNDPKSFLLEVSWTEDYPTLKPCINMNTFYNKHIENEIKEKIANAVLTEAEQYLGAAMTYTLFEFVKEKEVEFTETIAEKIVFKEDNLLKEKKIEQDISQNQKETPKKQHLTKAQKRRQWDRVGAKGEKPRGWNWVDLVKHLSEAPHKNSNEEDF